MSSRIWCNLATRSVRPRARLTPERGVAVGVRTLDVAQNRVNWTDEEAKKLESMALERRVTDIAYEIWLVL